KLQAQNNAQGGNGFTNRWLGGGDIYLVSAIGLQLGAENLLPPTLDTEIQNAIHAFNFFRNCDDPTNLTGNTCMDDYSVTAAGFAWAAAYQAKNGRLADAQQLAAQAQQKMHDSFSQSDSICLHRSGMGQSCRVCEQITDETSLRSQIANNQIDVLVFNHTF